MLAPTQQYSDSPLITWPLFSWSWWTFYNIVPRPMVTRNHYVAPPQSDHLMKGSLYCTHHYLHWYSCYTCNQPIIFYTDNLSSLESQFIVLCRLKVIQCPDFALLFDFCGPSTCWCWHVETRIQTRCLLFLAFCFLEWQGYSCKTGDEILM